MTNIFWFSRHDMTIEQTQALVNKFGNINITKVNGSPTNLYTDCEFDINGSKITTNINKFITGNDFNVIAIVAPIGLQQQFLKIADEIPVITAKTDRVIIKGDNGTEDKVAFNFNKWEQLVKIDIVMKDF